MSKEELTEAIRRVAAALGSDRLTERAFCAATGVPGSVIARHFDRWSEACTAAGLRRNDRPTLKPNHGPTLEECIGDVIRVAALLGKDSLTRDEYKTHGRWPSLSPMRRHFGDWSNALLAAGLVASPHYRDKTPFDVLATEFLRVAGELGRMPTIRELRRRTHRKWDRTAANHGGYAKLKVAIAQWHAAQDPATLGVQLPDSVLAQLGALCGTPEDVAPIPPRPHKLGRTLGFRQFAFAPTQEQDVVALFNSVAHELGFEVLANRVAFPDCLAREKHAGARPHYVQCRIEFEFRSRDYLSHRHPIDGCDLIVCWEHNWDGCPLRVIELRDRIRNLDGWS